MRASRCFKRKLKIRANFNELYLKLISDIAYKLARKQHYERDEQDCKSYPKNIRCASALGIMIRKQNDQYPGKCPRLGTYPRKRNVRGFRNKARNRDARDKNQKKNSHKAFRNLYFP